MDLIPILMIVFLGIFASFIIVVSLIYNIKEDEK